MRGTPDRLADDRCDLLRVNRCGLRGGPQPGALRSGAARASRSCQRKANRQ